MELANVVLLSLKTAFSVAVLYGFYRVALRKELHFAINRTFLLLAMLVSIAIPFISITIFHNVVVDQVAPSLTVLGSSQTMGAAPVVLDQPLSLVEIVGVAYIAVTGFMLLRLFFILLKVILSVSRNSRRETVLGKTVLISNVWSQTFSFFGIIIMSENDFQRSDCHLLVAHEQVHSRQLHTVDLLLVELFIAIQWYNPISYLLRNSLYEVHEYLADRCVIRGGADQISYKRLLLDCITTANMPTLSNSFSAKLSKRRFAMISKTYNTGNRRYKFLLSLPVAVALFALFSLKVEAKYIYSKSVIPQETPILVTKEVKSASITDSIVDSSSIKKLVDKCHGLVPGGGLLKDFEMLQVKPGEERKYSLVLSKGTTYSLASVTNANNLVPAWLIKSGAEKEIFPSLKLMTTDKYSMTAVYQIAETSVYEIVVKNTTSGTIDMVVSLFFTGQFDVDEIKASKKDSVRELDKEEMQETFFIVENMPEFEGQGIEHAREYLQKQIKFPETAKAKGITGRVYVSFVVTREGKVESVKVIRNLEPSLDKEAVRVVSEMPQWTPGKQRGHAVNVSFTIPIKFE
jgi:TonB family protein